MLKVIRLSALGVITSVMLSHTLACNTTEGAGKDIQKAGDKLQDAADRNK